MNFITFYFTNRSENKCHTDKCLKSYYRNEFYFCGFIDMRESSESESELLLVTRPNDNHSPGPVMREVSHWPLQEK